MADLGPVRTSGSETQEGVGDRAGARRSRAPGDKLELLGIVRLGVGGHRPEADPPYTDGGARGDGEHDDSIGDLDLARVEMYEAPKRLSDHQGLISQLFKSFEIILFPSRGKVENAVQPVRVDCLVGSAAGACTSRISTLLWAQRRPGQSVPQNLPYDFSRIMFVYGKRNAESSKPLIDVSLVNGQVIRFDDSSHDSTHLK